MNLTKNQIILLISLYVFIFIVGIFIGKYTEKLYGIERILLESKQENRGNNLNSQDNYHQMRMMRYQFQR